MSEKELFVSNIKAYAKEKREYDATEEQVLENEAFSTLEANNLERLEQDFGGQYNF